MTVSRTRSLRARLAAVALAGAAAATGAVVAAAPAQAFYTCGPSNNLCIMTIDRPHLVPPCPCELKLDFSYRDQLVMARVDALINEGAYDYRTAARTVDRTERARLEAAGTDLFTQAVRLVTVAPVMKPQPDPWTQAAGTDLVTGLQASFQAERTRDAATAAALKARAAAAYQSFGAR